MSVKHPRLNPPYNPKLQFPRQDAYGDLFPNRISVCRSQEDDEGEFPWEVWRGDSDTLATFPTHAEAIAYAQKIAHQNSDCTHRCGACRDLSHQHIACCPERRTA
ncbi:MAG: DUF2188 domain-containing protein [Arthrobacter sp.]|jgi:hypothetical protein|nr:DUF2188 domain-containing protein [Arthrobacter sp.]